MRQPPPAVGIFHQLLVFLIRTKRVAAGRHKLDNSQKSLGRNRRIRQSRLHLGKQLGLVERPRTGDPHYMLGKHIIAAGTKVLAVANAFGDRVEGRLRLEIFKPVAGD